MVWVKKAFGRAGDGSGSRILSWAWVVAVCNQSAAGVFFLQWAEFEVRIAEQLLFEAPREMCLLDCVSSVDRVERGVYTTEHDINLYVAEILIHFLLFSLHIIRRA